MAHKTTQELAAARAPATSGWVGKDSRQTLNARPWCLLRVAFGLHPPGQRRDRRYELAWIHRLGEVHFKAALEGFRPILRTCERRERGGRHTANRRVLMRAEFERLKLLVP